MRFAAQLTAAKRAVVDHAADPAERAAAERAGVVSAIAALEWRVAAERSAALAALAAVFGARRARRGASCEPELGSRTGRRSVPTCWPQTESAPID